MEYYNVVTNYTGRLTFMWSGKFNNNSQESQRESGNFYCQTEWEPCIASLFNSSYIYNIISMFRAEIHYYYYYIASITHKVAHLLNIK